MKAIKQLNPIAPAKNFFRDNRNRLLKRLIDCGVIKSDSFILLKGPIEQSIYDDDMEFHVAPENSFYFTFGISEADTYGLIDVAKNSATLFIKFPDPMKTYWIKYKSREDYMQTTEVDEILDFKELAETLEKRVTSQTLHLHEGINPYSKRPTLSPKEDLKDILSKYKIETTSLFEHFCEERVVKSPEEIRLIKQSVDLAVQAHLAAWADATPGKSEVQIANTFEMAARYLADGDLAFESIVATGENTKFLHHTSGALYSIEQNDLVLIDAGTKLFNYCSDLTRTIPTSGRYTEKQKAIYDLVLEAQQKVFSEVRPGQNWINLHILAEKTIVNGLVRLGLLRGDPQKLWENRVSYYFFPHGIGHYLGLYTHDLPGLSNLENDGDPLPNIRLRVRRKLQKGMVMTNEPGIYFIPFLLDKAFNDPNLAPHFVREVIEEYMKEVHGIRIEDDFVVTENGCEILSEALPKTTNEIEAKIAELRH